MVGETTFVTQQAIPSANLLKVLYVALTVLNHPSDRLVHFGDSSETQGADAKIALSAGCCDRTQYHGVLICYYLLIG